MIVLPPEVGESLGLGPMFQMVPFSHKVQRLDMTTTDGADRMFVLVIEDPGGRHGYAFQSEPFKAFAAQMVEASSGLLLPQSNQRNGNHE